MTDANAFLSDEEYRRVVSSLSATLVRALELWVMHETGGEVLAEAAIAGAAHLVGLMCKQISTVDERDEAVSVALLGILEQSGCNIGAVLGFVREQMEEHLTPTGRA